MKPSHSVVLFICLLFNQQAYAFLFGAELRGNITLEHRQFFHEGSLNQGTAQSSLILNPELYFKSDDGNTSFTYEPRNRFDRLDDGRNQMDLRQGLFQYHKNNFGTRVGVGQTFWGVMESVNIVDVINQTDAVDTFDGSEKLGQPMLNIIIDSEYGTLDSYYLPYFRERSFAGYQGRLAFPGLANQGANFESGLDEYKGDFAFRFSQIYGAWDLALSVFHGTSREPYYTINGKLMTSRQPGESIIPSKAINIAPFYAQMTQYGVESQYAIGDWLLKLEAVYRKCKADHTAVTLGTEYQLYGLEEYIGLELDGHELTVYGEYLYDSRGDRAFTLFQNDIFLGLNWNLHDFRNTEFQIGLFQDTTDIESRIWQLEVSSRIITDWKWSLSGHIFDSQSPDDALYRLREDDFVQFGISYFL
ncbi:hypothetical protein A8L45_02630 [Veronia pacifica]|uniref:Porin domain-containing protein n=1 Tax=Veronia pacifica TaxID=1080227 RepID=A0A1C3ES24_9GAMM|nr:hypothetical protein A8L45_02630 [Veronia pacifica]